MPPTGTELLSEISALHHGLGIVIQLQMSLCGAWHNVIQRQGGSSSSHFCGAVITDSGMAAGPHASLPAAYTQCSGPAHAFFVCRAVCCQVGVGHDGHPLLYGPPLVDLQGSFPLEQPLMPHLVPQSINMWMGCAPGGELAAPTQP